MLDMIMSFLDAYSKESSGDWYFLDISQEFEYSGNATYGYLKFQISLGCWWEGLLSRYPEIDDCMKALFTFDDNERKFTHLRKTFEATGIANPRKEINILVQKSLDNYEAKHPGVKFERDDWGAKIIKYC